MSISASVARARCSALFTDATVVSSSSATSVAFHRSTSLRISTERCRGGQVLQRGDEREPDRLARFGHVGGVAVDRDHTFVGDRLARTGARGSADRARRRPSRSRAPSPSAGRGVAGCATCRSTRCWRCGTATSAATSGPRTRRCRARRGPSSPAPRLRPRNPSRACGSRSRSARAGGTRGRDRDRPRPRGERATSPRWYCGRTGEVLPYPVARLERPCRQGNPPAPDAVTLGNRPARLERPCRQGEPPAPDAVRPSSG